MTRPSRDEYYLTMAEAAGGRSTCPRAHVGAVLTVNGSLIATGYNGSPAGTPHCETVGCAIVHDGDRERCIRAVHAEVNAILQGLRRGDVGGATLYTTHAPCLECAKVIINAGISRVFYTKAYEDSRTALVTGERSLYPGMATVEFLRSAGVEVTT